MGVHVTRTLALFALLAAGCASPGFYTLTSSVPDDRSPTGFRADALTVCDSVGRCRTWKLAPNPTQAPADQADEESGGQK
jgi:hypothetical protein